jgi:hypothetical protein
MVDLSDEFPIGAPVSDMSVAGWRVLSADAESLSPEVETQTVPVADNAAVAVILNQGLT